MRTQRASVVLKAIITTAAIIVPWAATAEGTDLECSLQLSDDRGQVVDENVTICRDKEPDSCFDLLPGQSSPMIEVGVLRAEGDGHGPTVAKPEVVGEGTCRLSVTRKATVQISWSNEDVERLTASFYLPSEDPEMLRPAIRVSAVKKQRIRVPVGAYVLSLAERGWAPDLRILDASPGSIHEFNYQRADGWSAVLRTITGQGSHPVPDADLEILTLPGFDETPPTDTALPTPPRTLFKAESSSHGLTVVSGLTVPVATASARHEMYLDAEIPAFSSDWGTFRVFNVRLHRGGSATIKVLREGQEATEALCELASPEIMREPPWGLHPPLHEGKADQKGVCRLTKVSAGIYALKVSLPESKDAFTVQPIEIRDEEDSEATVELWPLVVSGRVYKGDEGAAGYEVRFERQGPFEVPAPAYLAGLATTDEDGFYEVVLWAAGEYLGQVSTESSTAGNFKLVEIATDETVYFRIAKAELEGQVVDEAGAAIPEARISVRSAGLQRGVLPDQEGRFRVSFRNENDTIEVNANADGYYKAESQSISIDKDQQPEPVLIVLRKRQTQQGFVLLPSGRVASGVAVSVHRFNPDQYAYALERSITGEDGSFDLPHEAERLRLFFGGPGCALGNYDLPAASERGEEPIELRCEPPSHLIVRIESDDADLRSGSSILLRRGDVVIPPIVLAEHLSSLGLPTTTDGQGKIGLVALAPGSYEVYHGQGTSYRNLLDGYEAAKLSEVSLAMSSTVEIEVSLGFSLDRLDSGLFFDYDQ